jgi:hypothetical protein
MLSFGPGEDGSSRATELRSPPVMPLLADRRLIEKSATESDLDFYGEPISGITTMFMNCTISEDRTGTDEEIMAHRLAALGARCERKVDWRKIL